MSIHVLIDNVLLILGSILALSSLIVAKKPDAKQLIDKLTPYQATLGAILLGLGIWYFISNLSLFTHPTALGLLFGLAAWGMIVTMVLLGVMFGMPMVAKLSAEGAAKGEAMAKKLAPFQTLIGLVGLGSALIMLLYYFKILTFSVSGVG
jgi:hypothetical protein